ncbi:MAG: hypothetical protein RIS09_157 [Actinomycetota bacterium]|jgi:hypothetical protein
MKFIIFVVDGESNSATGNEIEAIDAFNARLQEKNYWVMAVGIHGPSNATLIDNRNGANLQNSGSLFAAAEHYSGFWIIDVPNEETANLLAHEGSKACNRRVELRPFLS